MSSQLEETMWGKRFHVQPLTTHTHTHIYRTRNFTKLWNCRKCCQTLPYSHSKSDPNSQHPMSSKKNLVFSCVHAPKCSARALQLSNASIQSTDIHRSPHRPRAVGWCHRPTPRGSRWWVGNRVKGWWVTWVRHINLNITRPCIMNPHQLLEGVRIHGSIRPEREFLKAVLVENLG